MNSTVTAEKLLATLSSDPLVASGAAIAVACTCLITYFASSLTHVEKGKKVALRALKAVASASKAMAYEMRSEALHAIRYAIAAPFD